MTKHQHREEHVSVFPEVWKFFKDGLKSKVKTTTATFYCMYYIVIKFL